MKHGLLERQVTREAAVGARDVAAVVDACRAEADWSIVIAPKKSAEQRCVE
jgi:hypothetical protein